MACSEGGILGRQGVSKNTRRTHLLHTGNCSQVDRLWSVLPLLYLSLFAKTELKKGVDWLHGEAGAAQPDPRLMAQW